MADTNTTGCGALAMGYAFLCAAAALAGDVASYRGTENNGIYHETGLMKAWPDEGPKFLWKRMLGQAYCGVSVVDGVVWILSGPEGTMTGFSVDGEVKHTYRVGNMTCPGSRFPGPRCTPLIQNGTAVVARVNADIVGIDLKTGETKWTVNAWKGFGSGKGHMGWGYPSSPVSFENKVILNPVSRDDATPPIVAVDFATGQTVWQADPGAGKRYSCGDHAAAVFRHNGRWLNVNPTWRYILCLDPRDGKKLWEIPDNDVKNGSEKGLSPVYGDGYLLFDRAGVATCVRLNEDGSDFTPVWARQYSGQGFSHGVILGKRVYLAGTILDRTWRGVAALEQASLNAPGYPPLSWPKDAKAPPPSMPRGLICVDAETGRVLDVIRMRETLGHVVAADGMIYAVDYESAPKVVEGVPKPGLNAYLIQPTEAGMEIRGQFRLPMTHDDWKVKDIDWQANAPPVISHGRLFIRYGPLWTYDLRPDMNPKPATAATLPPDAHWDLFLRGFFGDDRDLLVTLQVRSNSVVSAVAAAPEWNRAFHAVHTAGAKIGADGVAGVFKFTINPDSVSSNSRPAVCEVKLDTGPMGVGGRVTGTYSGGETEPAFRYGDRAREEATITVFTGKPRGTRVDGRVTKIPPPPPAPPPKDEVVSTPEPE
jgi:hypothetical protein